MIAFNGKEISEIHYGGKKLSLVYRCDKLVWQAIRSCFGSGFWVNGKPWLNGEGYKN